MVMTREEQKKEAFNIAFDIAKQLEWQAFSDDYTTSSHARQMFPGSQVPYMLIQDVKILLMRMGYKCEISDRGDVFVPVGAYEIRVTRKAGREIQYLCGITPTRLELHHRDLR